jgi:hypothetical protein
VTAALPILAALLAAPVDVPPPPAPGAPPATDVARDDLPIAVTWMAPEGCPGVDALKAEIRRVAGPVAPPPERLEAEATVRRASTSSWQLTLTTRAGERMGERRLSAGDCTELMHAAALVMALMINPNAGAEPPPPPPPPSPPPPPPPPPPPEAEQRFAAGADVVVGTGALPGVAPGIGLRFAAAAGAFAAEARASLWLSRSTAAPADATTGGSFDLVDVALAGCASARRAQRVSPRACAGASLVRVAGSGYGVSEPGSASAFWSAAFIEASLRVRVTPRNAVRLGLQGLASLGRPSFALDGVGTVFRPDAFWARATLGWELHF